MKEPHITKEDAQKWDMWKRICLMHANTNGFKRRVAVSTACIRRMCRSNPDAYLAWSAGKDSTVMAHLAASEMSGAVTRAMSVKDDLDFPGEVEYLERYAEDWGITLDILTPSFSLEQWLIDHDVSIMEDLHSRGGEFSDDGFYSLIEEYRVEMKSPGVYLGLRKDESKGRLMNRISRGLIYYKKSTEEMVCQPIADWSGKDVYAYMFSRGIDPHPLYRCIGHHDTPERIRKSWWIMGKHSAKGAAIWLRTYYPSLWARLNAAIPDSSGYA